MQIINMLAWFLTACEVYDVVIEVVAAVSPFLIS
jgi:hypothetical protein